MAANKLFLVLPIANNNALDEERVYLKVLSAASEPKEFEGILKRVVAAFRWVEGEEYVLYYDHSRFRDLYKKCSPEVQMQRPSPVQLLSILSQMTKVPDKMPDVRVNHVPLKQGILYGFVNLEGEALIDHDALENREYIKVEDVKGSPVNLVVVNCKREDVFQWFVKNRNPVRVIDVNYAKHGAKEKGAGKEVISARSYSDEEYQAMLPWAIGAVGCRKKYFMDLNKGRLVIFWNENLEIPTYHYYDVDIDDASENAKMWQEGGREMVDQIKAVAALKK